MASMQNISLPKISLITICRNAVNSIDQAFQSVFNQAYPNLEYIVIDGGSTDGTLDVISKNRSKFAYFISEPDNGISDAFNKGLRQCTGDVIAILNADDTLLSGSLQKVADDFLSNPQAIIFGNMIYRDPETHKEWIVKPDINKMNNEMSLYHIACFIPKSVYKQIGEYDLNYKLAMDYDLFIRALSLKIPFIYKDYSYGVMNKGGMSFKHWNKALKEQAQIQIKYSLDSKFSIKIRLFKRLIKDSLIDYLERNNWTGLLKIIVKAKKAILR
jgi:glycosyltransferase involved in cell wall biosynthesis